MSKERKNDRKHFLLSRKWWTAMIAVIGIPLNQIYGIELPTEALITVAVVAAAYILGEGRVDIEAIRKKER